MHICTEFYSCVFSWGTFLLWSLELFLFCCVFRSLLLKIFFFCIFFTCSVPFNILIIIIMFFIFFFFWVLGKFLSQFSKSLIFFPYTSHFRRFNWVIVDFIWKQAFFYCLNVYFIRIHFTAKQLCCIFKNVNNYKHLRKDSSSPIS